MENHQNPAFIEANSHLVRVRRHMAACTSLLEDLRKDEVRFVLEKQKHCAHPMFREDIINDPGFEVCVVCALRMDRR